MTMLGEMNSSGPIVGRFGQWAERKTDEHGDPLDLPKLPKADAGYVRPPEGVAISCDTCVHFREPDECAEVGNKGAIIYPDGCCNRWAHPEALVSTFGDPNPGDDGSRSEPRDEEGEGDYTEDGGLEPNG